MTDFGNTDIFASNLQHFMKINHKNRRDLERDLGFTYSTLSKWINAERYPRIDKIEKLASYFNIEKSDLIERKQKNSLHLLLGENLRNARLNARMTVEQVAKALDVPVYHVTQYEEANRLISVELLYNMAKLFSVKMDDLVTSHEVLDTSNKRNRERHIDMWENTIEPGSLTTSEVEEMIKYAQFLISKRGV